MKRYYQIYHHCHNSYPMAKSILVYVDTDKVENEEMAVRLSHSYVLSREGYVNNSVPLGVTESVKEEILSTEDKIIYYIDHYKVIKLLKSYQR